MYYNDYEDYMGSVLGYPNMNDNTYQRYSSNNYYGTNDNMNCCGMNYDNNSMNQMDWSQYRNNSMSTEQIERMYPEIYRVINPMVCRMCDNNTQPVTEYLVEQMTDDIYDNVVNRVEIQNVINVNITTRETDMENGDREDSCNNRSTNISSNKSTANSLNNNDNAIKATSDKTTNYIKTNDIQEDSRETRSPQPRRRNRLLRDLIRILILNRLLRQRRPHRPNRPPFRPNPGPRPGMPGFGPRSNALGQPDFREPIPRMEMSQQYTASDYFPYL